MNKLKTLYRKLVDKIFGKRCACTEPKPKAINVCTTCGKLHG